MWRDDAALLDILLAAGKACRYVSGVGREDLLHNSLLQDGVVRCLEVIGEAARRVSPGFRDAHPQIPWTRLVGLRNILIHEYFRVDLARVWEIAASELPSLIRAIEPLVPPEKAGD